MCGKNETKPTKNSNDKQRERKREGENYSKQIYELKGSEKDRHCERDISKFIWVGTDTATNLLKLQC